MDLGLNVAVMMTLRIIGLALIIHGSYRACISGYRYRYTGRLRLLRLLTLFWLSVVGGLLVKTPLLAVETILTPEALALASAGGVATILCFALGMDLANRTRRD